tara:strand:+ start:16933 stop:17151 length:219 start_codon:yes stop_codon:yes gene_type:complete
MRPVWLVGFPTGQYNEDVKAVASAAGLRIIDARFKDQFSELDLAKNPPSITRIGEKKKRKPRKKAAKVSDSE